MWPPSTWSSTGCHTKPSRDRAQIPPGHRPRQPLRTPPPSPPHLRAPLLHQPLDVPPGRPTWFCMGQRLPLSPPARGPACSAAPSSSPPPAQHMWPLVEEEQGHWVGGVRQGRPHECLDPGTRHYGPVTGSHVHTRGLGGGLFPPPERPQQQAGPLANAFPWGQDSCPPCAPRCPGPGPRAGNAARAACVSVLSKRPFPASPCGVCDRGVCVKHCWPPTPSPACWPTRPRRWQLLAPQRPKGRVQCTPRAPTQAHSRAVRAPGEGAPFS